MRIVSVAARTIHWPIGSDGAARGRTERAAVVIEVRSDRGVVGLGEAAPLPGPSRDTLDDAERAIAAFAAGAPFEVADREVGYAIAASAVGSPAARFAIETAVLDALARDHGVSLAALLAAPDRTSRPVPLAAVVDDPVAARAALARGIRCLKIKVSADDGIGRILAIAAAAPAARLRIDANRSWPRDEVPHRLARLSQLPIDYVEEPCIDAHLVLGEPLALKLALDESLTAIALPDLRAALGSPNLVALVLKPTLLGGLSAVLALAHRARAVGVAAVVSHGLEGPIGTAACAELALALGGSYPAGLAAHPALAAWRLDVPQLAADHLHHATGPGLGFVDLDVDRYLAGCVRACAATPA